MKKVFISQDMRALANDQILVARALIKREFTSLFGEEFEFNIK